MDIRFRGARSFVLRTLATIALFLSAALLAADPPHTATPATAVEVTAKRQLSLADKLWKGDFDALVNRRLIRVLVPYSRTLYFNDKGRERGVTADLVREFERYVNKKYKTGTRPLTVYIIPTTRDNLLPYLVAGRGDIAAGNLSVTDDRKAIVDFAVAPLPRPIREIVIAGAKAAPIASADELSGKTVNVRKSSSYYETLDDLNKKFRDVGKKEITLQLVPDALEDEDMMEMANAGIIDYMIVDDWKAQVWTPILPNINANPNVFVHDGGQIGWAVRKESPQLIAAIDDFYKNAVRQSASYEYRLKQAIQRARQMKDPTQTADWKRFQEILALFNRYGDRYGFDPLMLAAQGYQESTLNQEAKSGVGAIGVMQLMPATGKDMNVGDIHVTEANIHAGTKYMDILMTKYFPDAHFTAETRPLFAFASYNAGPGNIARMRKEAEKRGLNPDKWFNNVELVVAEKIGIETTTYVRNIYKYYVAYKLSMDADLQRKKVLQEIEGTAQ